MSLVKDIGHGVGTIAVNVLVAVGWLVVFAVLQGWIDNNAFKCSGREWEEAGPVGNRRGLVRGVCGLWKTVAALVFLSVVLCVASAVLGVWVVLKCKMTITIRTLH